MTQPGEGRPDTQEFPLRGSVIWLTPEQGGRATGPPPRSRWPYYARPAPMFRRVPQARGCAAPWQTGIYAPHWTEQTYQELLGRAGRLLARGESVIADASWESPGRRAAAGALAGTAQADLVALRCVAPADVAQRRLAVRTAGISDADVAVARQMAATQAPWPEAVTIDTGGAGRPGPPGTDAVQQAINAIRPPDPQQTGVRSGRSWSRLTDHSGMAAPGADPVIQPGRACVAPCEGPARRFPSAGIARIRL